MNNKNKKEFYNNHEFTQWIEENHKEKIYYDYQIEEAYDSLLDDCHDEVKIAGYTYSTSEALKAVDPIAYRCGLADFSSMDYIEIPRANFYLSTESYDELCDEYEDLINSKEE